MEALLLVVQTLTTISCFLVFVFALLVPLDPEGSNDPKELNNLLVPPDNVLRVAMNMLLCFLFSILMAPKATTGSFIERYSTGEDNELQLNLAAFVANISTGLWMISKLFQWRYLAIIAFVFIWCGSLPIYLALNQKRPRVNTCRDALIIYCEQLSVRLYFTWLTGAVIFGLLDVAQYIHGSIFSYDVYAGVMVIALTVVFVTYGRTQDPAVAIMALWFLCQIIDREGVFEGDDDAKETFEKLLPVANIMAYVLSFIVMIDCTRNVRADARRELKYVQLFAEALHVKSLRTNMLFSRCLA
eukprot:jgi/Phyca11/120488/e_gw1.41.223.1